RPNGHRFDKLKTRDPVTEVAVAPDGTAAFGGSYGAFVVAPGGKPRPVPGANDVIQGLAFEPDGRRLALILYGAGRLWTVGRRTSEEISRETSALAFGPAGRLVTGGLGGDVVVRNGPGKGARLGQLGNATIQSVDAR